jgi:hypothetical protein
VSARWDTTGTANVIGKEYFVHQAAILYGLAKATTDPKISAALLDKVVDLKSQVHELGAPPDAKPLAPDIEPPATTFRLAEGRRRVRAGTAGRLHPRGLSAISRHSAQAYPMAGKVKPSRLSRSYSRPLRACRTTRQSRKAARSAALTHEGERFTIDVCMLVSETLFFTRLGPPSCQASQKNASIAATS